jgi:anaphase-promoting complex subunit 6
MQGQFSRAERLLTRPFPLGPPKTTKPILSMNGSMSQPPLSGKGKGKEKETPLSNPMTMPRLPMDAAAMISIPEDINADVTRLVDVSVACRYLAAQCQVRTGTYM